MHTLHAGRFCAKPPCSPAGWASWPLPEGFHYEPALSLPTADMQSLKRALAFIEDGKASWVEMTLNLSQLWMQPEEAELLQRIAPVRTGQN